MSEKQLQLAISVKPDILAGVTVGYYVWLGDSCVGYRRGGYASAYQVEQEVTDALAMLLRERLDWAASP